MSVVTDSYKHFKSYTPLLLLAVLFGICSDVSALLIPLLPMLFIDRIIYPALGNVVTYKKNLFDIFIENQTNYWVMFGILAAVFFILLFVRYLFNYIEINMAQYFGCKVENNLREKTLKRVIDQNALVMSNYTSGELISICNSDIINIKEVYCTQVSQFIWVLEAWGIGSYFLARINPFLVIVPIVGGIFTLIVMKYYSDYTRRRFNAIRQVRMDMSTVVQENIQGVRVVRSYASEDVEQKKFDNANENIRKTFINAAQTQAKFNIFFNAISNFILFGSLIVGIYLSLNGAMSIGQFATFFAYVTMISTPFTTFANILALIQSAVVSANRLFTFLKIENEIEDDVNAIELNTVSPNLCIKNMCLQLNEKTVLRNINIDLPYGKSIGIMGKTGSGKSILLKTISRFFDCTDGCILLNDIYIKDVKLEDVRMQYSYVMQDVFLFSDTVKNNIKFFDPSIDDENVYNVAKLASAHDFILKLEDGYSTVVGERGVGLSGGQKQRISIARALLKDAPIFLFDDCTSALDTETEKNILNGIKQNYKEKSLIITSHRASSVMYCDEILFMDDGEIIERGTHDELMDKKGRYFDIYSSQESARLEAIA